MKNIKIYLSVAAFTLAIGGVFASKSMVTVDSYRKINDGTPVSADCTLIGQCADTGLFRCKANISGVATELFKLNTGGTACDVSVQHTSASIN